MLETYPELAQYVTNDNGKLNIKQEGLDKLYQDKTNTAAHLSDINSVQQVNTLQAENDKAIEDFSNKNGIPIQEIKAAIESGNTTLVDANNKTVDGFATLVNTIQTNNTSIDGLNSTIGTLNAKYTDYSKQSNTSEEVSNAEEAIKKKYGTIQQSNNRSSSSGTKVDFSTKTDDQDFIDAVAEATGKKIISAQDTS